MAEPREPFVCPWCGASFARRFIASDGVYSLEEHWRVSPECSSNRAVNNPTQSKYDEPPEPITVHPSTVRLLVEQDRDA